MRTIIVPRPSLAQCPSPSSHQPFLQTRVGTSGTQIDKFHFLNCHLIDKPSAEINRFMIWCIAQATVDPFPVDKESNTSVVAGKVRHHDPEILIWRAGNVAMTCRCDYLPVAVSFNSGGGF